MGKQAIPIELQSLVETHRKPFLVIDSGHWIVAVNRAYEKSFGIMAAQAVGHPCYEILHNLDVPCYTKGEVCPHQSLYSDGESTSCLHNHYNVNEQLCQVQVSAFPLHGSDGKLYMGELIEDFRLPEECVNHRMVGGTRAFMACQEQLKVAAAAEAPVLIQGETGTGKELAAQYVHLHSPRREQPFLTVDCTALTDTLFESEVFGHAQGAFTGSVGERVGLFEQASGGTLFLDEVGELPLTQQAKLLRALETGQFRRVGGRQLRNSDVRIICATNRHLWDGVTAGKFREDFYYRIACLAVRLPPLRERLDDIDLLVPSLLESISRTMHQRYTLSPAAVQHLKQYEYPGNVRELRNILYVVASRSPGDCIDERLVADVLEEHVRVMSQELPSVTREFSPTAAARSEGGNNAVLLRDVEAKHIIELLQRFDDNRRKVAAALGISERTLYRKLKLYALN